MLCLLLLLVAGGLAARSGDLHAAALRASVRRYDRSKEAPPRADAKAVKAFIDYLRAHDGKHHQQRGYKRIDPEGDATLIRMLDSVPNKLLEALINDSYVHGQNKDDEDSSDAPQYEPDYKDVMGSTARQGDAIDLDSVAGTTTCVISSSPPIDVKTGSTWTARMRTSPLPCSFVRSSSCSWAAAGPRDTP